MMEPRVSGPALTTVKRLRPYSVNIFAAMSALATEVGAVNLGQGFPDEDGPPAMLEAARRAIAEGVNQYPPGPGIAALREAIAAQRMRRYRMAFDPGSEVLVTVGASEAIAAAVLGLVEPGSEVLLIEPFFDTYSPVIAMAGSRRVSVSLVPDGRGFALDIDAVRSAITPLTRAIIVNSPHNPTGLVLSDNDLRALAAVAVEADLLVISDEVYEHLVFDGAHHLPIATYPGMAQRTVTISSAAKMFNCTGWKIGWACGPANLIAGVRAAKQYLSYVGGAPFPSPTHWTMRMDGWSHCASHCRPGATYWPRRWPTSVSRYTRAQAPSSCAQTRVRWASPTAPHSAPSCRTGPQWRRYPCRHSATLSRRRPDHGITWCASRSASAMPRWRRRSGDSRYFAGARASCLLELEHLLAQAVGGGLHGTFDGALEQESGDRHRGLDGDLEAHFGLGAVRSKRVARLLPA
jgi:N-succinyldiaminopimelate aminotransferase